MGKTTDEVRSRGDATDEQRTELRRLITERAVSPVWKHQFYAEVKRAGGLSQTMAADALIYVRSLAAAGCEPAYATPDQGETLRRLARTRLVPSPIRRIWLDQLDTNRLTYQHADRTILEWLRMPHVVYVRTGDLRNPTTGTAPDGYFALTREEDGRPRCYRVSTNLSTGRRIVEQITGEKPSQRRVVRGVDARHVLTAVADDVATAASRYGEIRARCSDCNQPLKRVDQPGYAYGYGPDCWKARQAPAAATA